MGPLCYGCFMPLKGYENVCPHCGYHINAKPSSEQILKPGTVLNQKYTIGKTLGEGGFGITYLAWDNNMQTKIAIKEFFPANLVARDTDSESNTKIYTISKAYSNEFHAGMDRFVKEAAVLAKFFKLQGIVSVKDFFYENGTAYIVMEYIEGITLKEYLRQKGGKLSVEETLALMKPVMESLAIVHKEKMLHRDISPDNLMVSNDFQVKLIDFGSARYFDSQSDKSMTVILKHGYAPIEQYSSNGNQGTWTDVYSLCATIYRMLTGIVPDESINRIKDDGLQSIRSLVGKIPKNIESAIVKGLSVMPENRQQTVEELYHELYISRQDLRVARRNRAYQSINKILTAMIVVLILVIGLFAFAWTKREKIQDFQTRVSNAFSAEETDYTSDKEESKEGGQSLEQEDREQKEEKASKEESQRTTTELEEEENRQDKASNAMADPPADESPTMQADTAADAGTQSYQLMRAGTESASQTDSSVVVVRDGILNNVAQDYTVGEILNLYSDMEGRWYTYNEQETSQTYVYYEGRKDGESFVLEFEVYTNDTFKLTGAAKNNSVIERYSDFFQEILDSLGF